MRRLGLLCSLAVFLSSPLLAQISTGSINGTVTDQGAGVLTKAAVTVTNKGTGAATRVLIDSSDGDATWTTIGVNENIIEASWQALLDSIHFGLLRAELASD